MHMKPEMELSLDQSSVGYSLQDKLSQFVAEMREAGQQTVAAVAVDGPLPGVPKLDLIGAPCQRRERDVPPAPVEPMKQMPGGHPSGNPESKIQPKQPIRVNEQRVPGSLDLSILPIATPSPIRQEEIIRNSLPGKDARPVLQNVIHAQTEKGSVISLPERPRNPVLPPTEILSSLPQAERRKPEMQGIGPREDKVTLPPLKENRTNEVQGARPEGAVPPQVELFVQRLSEGTEKCLIEFFEDISRADRDELKSINSVLESKAGATFKVGAFSGARTLTFRDGKTDYSVVLSSKGLVTAARYEDGAYPEFISLSDAAKALSKVMKDRKR